METKVAVIGVGGRTGTMFAYELQNAAEVVGVARKEEVDLIKKKKLYIEKSGSQRELFQGRVISEDEFPGKELPDIIFLATKNPVGLPVKSYYQKISDFLKGKEEKLPSLVLSQNGIAASKEALTALKEVFGEKGESIQIIRVCLLNPIEKKIIKNGLEASSKKDFGNVCINYFLPIRLTFGVFSGSKDTQKIEKVFKEAHIEAQKVLPEDVTNMEFSKLFSNLLGVVSAVEGFSIKDGFKKKDVFVEEINVLREYIKVVKTSGGRFLNLPNAPIAFLATLIEKTPLPVLGAVRSKIGSMISKGRGGKPKGNLDEIDYYIGAIVELGKTLSIDTPSSKKVLKKTLKKLATSSRMG